jgi:hypothetical protein
MPGDSLCTEASTLLAIARTNKLITIQGNSAALNQAALCEEDMKLLAEEPE